MYERLVYVNFGENLNGLDMGMNQIGGFGQQNLQKGQVNGMNGMPMGMNVNQMGEFGPGNPPQGQGINMNGMNAGMGFGSHQQMGTNQMGGLGTGNPSQGQGINMNGMNAGMGFGSHQQMGTNQMGGLGTGNPSQGQGINMNGVNMGMGFSSHQQMGTSQNQIPLNNRKCVMSGQEIKTKLGLDSKVLGTDEKGFYYMYDERQTDLFRGFDEKYCGSAFYYLVSMKEFKKFIAVSMYRSYGVNIFDENEKEVKDGGTAFRNHIINLDLVRHSLSKPVKHGYKKLKLFDKGRGYKYVFIKNTLYMVNNEEDIRCFLEPDGLGKKVISFFKKEEIKKEDFIAADDLNVDDVIAKGVTVLSNDKIFYFDANGKPAYFEGK